MPNRRFALALILTPLLGLVPRGVVAQQTADLIITNARIYTVDENRPLVFQKPVP